MDKQSAVTGIPPPRTCPADYVRSQMVRAGAVAGAEEYVVPLPYWVVTVRACPSLLMARSTRLRFLCRSAAGPEEIRLSAIGCACS